MRAGVCGNGNRLARCGNRVAECGDSQPGPVACGSRVLVYACPPDFEEGTADPVLLHDLRPDAQVLGWTMRHEEYTDDFGNGDRRYVYDYRSTGLAGRAFQWGRAPTREEIIETWGLGDVDQLNISTAFQVPDTDIWVRGFSSSTVEIFNQGSAVVAPLNTRGWTINTAEVDGNPFQLGAEVRMLGRPAGSSPDAPPVVCRDIEETAFGTLRRRDRSGFEIVFGDGEWKTVYDRLEERFSFLGDPTDNFIDRRTLTVTDGQTAPVFLNSWAGPPGYGVCAAVGAALGISGTRTVDPAVLEHLGRDPLSHGGCCG